MNSLDSEFDVGPTVSNLGELLAKYALESAGTRERLKGFLTARFGPTLPETLDFFPCGSDRGSTCIFFHGGYWRRLSKDDNSFIAERLVEAGVNVAVVNYALAPAVTLDEIVRQCRAAIFWVYENADRLSIDPGRLYVAGHSAGGHLAAMTAGTDWAADYGLPADIIKGVTAISGLFDLRSARHTFLNEWLKLNAESAERNSPVLHPPRRPCRLSMWLAERDTQAFHAQASQMESAWKLAGCEVELHPPIATDHFNILFSLTDATSPILYAMFAQMMKCEPQFALDFPQVI